MKPLVLITTTILVLCTNVWSQGLETFDILQPIVKISPARNEVDKFGYSVTAHQLVELSANDSFQKALDNTVIMVGAPDGQFPGGISGIEPNGLVCSDTYPNFNESQLLALNDSEIWPCYENITTGLVYTCPLNSGQCGATLGNGNPTGPDGLLFDRVGNGESIHDKNLQLMGKTVYSNGDHFVACAPLWEFVELDDGILSSQPRGRCVYSNRTLTNFSILFPCDADLGANANNQNNEGFCTTGSSVHLTDDNDVTLAVSTPGRHFSRGGAFYYDLDGPDTMIDGDTTRPNFVPSRGGEVIGRSQDFQNVFNNLSYYGFAITSGYLTSNITKDFALSAPQRIDALTYLGRVYVVTDFKSLPVIFVEGEQLGEYFGYSMAAIDLNGDGWDDLVISAPMYSENSRPELGQVYIYLNNEGVFQKNTVIIGTAVSGRFGICVEGLGDINNDGYEDFAVSAPYEGRGVVYIYHGQQMDVNGTIVNTQYQQRINGSAMVDRVSNLTNVTLFGFSLSGTVDVDNNLYRDLVIGAHESQSVFVLRSIPVATVNISITTNVEEVELDSFNCTDFNEQPVTCFDVVVTAQFVGRGLNSGFSAYYLIREDIQVQQTVFFNANLQNSMNRLITFDNEDDIFSETLKVYFLNDTSVSGDRSFLILTVEMLQISRPDVIVDTNLSPSDLSQSPVINSLPDTLNVTVASQCGEDEICDSNLRIELLNITYLTASGQEYEDQSQLTVDAVDRVDVSLSFENLGENAFNAFITFTLPRNIFSLRRVLPPSIIISCNDTTPQNIQGTYICNVRSPLTKEDGRTNISLRWEVNETFQGEQDRVSIPISFMIPTVPSNREMSSLLNDNVVNVEFDITAIADYRFTAIFSSDLVSYQGNFTPRVDRIASNLGEDIQLSVTLRNDGPSTIRDATLNIFIPAQLSSVTRDNYFYYPATLTIRESDAICNDQSVLNPLDYNTDATKKRRRKRLNRSGPIDHHTLLRMVRQTTFDLDCEQTPELCINLKCNVSELDSSITLEILGYLDERFYNGRSNIYNLRAYATVEILDRFTEANGPLNTTAELELFQFRRSTQSSGLPPWYVIAVPIVAALLFLIILAVVLYFFGFFRRKKTKEETDENQVGEDFEQFDTNPFGKSGTGAKEIPQPKGQPELTNFEPVQT